MHKIGCFSYVILNRNNYVLTYKRNLLFIFKLIISPCDKFLYTHRREVLIHVFGFDDNQIGMNKSSPNNIQSLYAISHANAPFLKTMVSMNRKMYSNYLLKSCWKVRDFTRGKVLP